MHAGDRYSLKEFLLWTRRDTYTFLIIATIPTLLHALLGIQWLGVPWVPIALVGTAAAFIVGFRNNATYARLWEARQIYGAIVNTSRTWALMVKDFIQPSDNLTEAEAITARTTLIHRHIAWLTAMRFQLRQPRLWESMNLPHNQEYQAKVYTVDELKGDLTAELAKCIPPSELRNVTAASNRATALISLQGNHLAALFRTGCFDSHTHIALERVLADLYDQQGKCERIKNFPYPRQFATINRLFINVFIWLIPFGLIGELQKLDGGRVWLTIPFTVLIAWVFNAMERVGQSTENPFEGSANDVPITAMSRSIEIDLREMLGEANIPPPLKPMNNILM